MEIDTIYQNVEDVHAPQTQSHKQNEGKAQNKKGSRCLVLMTVCLGLICVLLLVFVILQLTTITNLIDTNEELLSILKLRNASGQVCFTISNETMSWSESRQYCRDRGADLIIINTEEKQRFISSFIMDRVWIGLTDSENEGIMKWVDNSPLNLNQTFWYPGEPNGNVDEDCIELFHGVDPVNNWNDIPCSFKIKCICEN